MLPEAVTPAAFAIVMAPRGAKEVPRSPGKLIVPAVPALSESAFPLPLIVVETEMIAPVGVTPFAVVSHVEAPVNVTGPVIEITAPFVVILLAMATLAALATVKVPRGVPPPTMLDSVIVPAVPAFRVSA